MVSGVAQHRAGARCAAMPRMTFQAGIFKNVAMAVGLGVLAGGIRLAQRRRRAVSFERRTVVITGGSRGLGLVIARELAEEGARLVLLSRDEDELARAAIELREAGASVETIPCDVRVQAEVVARFARPRRPLTVSMS